MGHIFLLSLAAALNPVLVGASTVMLLLPNPKRLMLGYLLGALMTSITLGLVIVYALKGSSTVSTTQNTVSPAVDLALGAILLVAAVVLGTGRDKQIAERRQARKGPKEEKGPPRWQQALSKGSARTTFVVGAVLTLPGGSYLAGLQSHREAEAEHAGHRADRDRIQPGHADIARDSAGRASRSLRTGPPERWSERKRGLAATATRRR